MKNKFNKLVFVFSFFLIFSSCSNDDEGIDSTPPLNTLEAIELMDVSYGSDELQTYDIYLPKDRTASNTKVFVLIHGGGWVSGDKSELEYLVNLLKSNFSDYAIVNLNYRLASISNNPFPMQTDDVTSVINDLKDKSSQYQINSDFAFIGLSAGAHLSMLYSYSLDTNEDVEMVCSIVGPTNFTDPNYIDNPEYQNFVLAIQLITGVPFASNPEYYENLSPYHVVNGSAPPSILFYGGKDELVPVSQGTDLRDKLNDLGVINEFTLYENEGHGWEGENAIDTQNKLIDFINLYF